ncbi:MAG: hypothetical protein NZ600_05640 [Acidimicrobiales bacterium]|nr:hypothetical protein [Acidimicrobiales bacterium]
MPTTTPVPATTGSPPVTTSPASTTIPPPTTAMAGITSWVPDLTPTTTEVPIPTTSLAGGPIPPAFTGFCADLAGTSAELVLEVESVMADGELNARRYRALLLATRNLLAWTSNRVPEAMAFDLALLTRVYAELGIELDRLNPDAVTMPRLQALVFSYVFESPGVEGPALDLAARRLSAFVERSCGSGYPLMESLSDLFAGVRVD